MSFSHDISNTVGHVNSIETLKAKPKIEPTLK